MEPGELECLILLHVATGVWLGVLASRWKGRSAWRWTAFGLLTSVFGLVMLARLDRRTPSRARCATDMHSQHLDGTKLLQP